MSMFQLGVTQDFRLVASTLDTSTNTSSSADLSTASSVVVHLVTLNDPISSLASTTCSSGYSGADWANGIVTGKFIPSDTSSVTDYTKARLAIKATIGTDVYVYKMEEVLDIQTSI